MDWWRAPLESVLRGRRVVVAGGPAAAWTATVPTLRDLGASDVLVIGTEGMGGGPPPDATTVVVDKAPDADVMASIRAGLRVLDAPPATVRAAVDAFDPDGTALVLGTFLVEAPSVLGRPLLAHRRPEWVALEDKVLVDPLLTRAGVARAPSAVVAAADAASSWRPLDQGRGTVWAADARDGYHGGGTGTRWVTDDHEARVAADELAARADRVRIMPFLDGVATSIHGIVLPDGVVALRPVELVTLRRGHALVYAGCATFWDPPEAVRDEMVEAARRVGEQLRVEVDYRGAFTLDGVATAEGFRPTELNPRAGAGLGVVARGLERLPLMLVLDLVVAGRDVGVSAGDLESELLAAADARRAGGTWQAGLATDAHLDGRKACFGDGAWRWAGDDERGDGYVVAGEGFVRLELSRRTSRGPSVGPRCAAFWRFADDVLGTSVGPLEPAPDLCR